MTIETEIAGLTQATTDLLAAVNVRKATLDEKVSMATAQAGLATTNGAEQVGLAATQAGIATTQAGIAATKAGDSAASATASQASANNAASAVVSQLTSIKTQTETARDQALAGLGAADNSQSLVTLAGQDTYAIDIAGQAVRELTGLPGGVEVLANFMTTALDLAGTAGRQAAAAAQVVPAPANASARGSPGEWAWDSNYVYVCTALNTWKRVAIATW